jgi:predicted acylesterase/phospholipase RssA
VEVPTPEQSQHQPHLPIPAYAGVFGGGGLFGIGYAMGVLHGLRERGIDLRHAPMLGTSAGSWAAAATALGVTHNDLIQLEVPRFPNPRRGVLYESAQAVFGTATVPNVRVVVTEVPRLRRTVLSGALTPVSELVAASSAVPGLLAPQRINGKSYVDGGVKSGCSVDLADAAHTLIVITPLAGAMFGPFGRFVDNRTDREQAIWFTQHGGTFIEFSPRRATADVAKRPQHLFDRSRAIEAYHRGYDEAIQRQLPTP